MLAFCVVAAVSLAQNPGYQPDPNWHAPADAASRQNPLASKPATAAGGRKLFIRDCVECHGKEGRGMETKHSADLQLPVVQQQSDGVLFWKITNGNASRGMPSFSKLPELQRWQIVLYLRTLKPVQQ
jgi:mono/diheme cytochrome c family protein